MRKFILNLILCALVATSALAQSAVPIEKEPMHRLKFENDFVRFFDVFIPAGRTSRIHTHLYDGLSIRLSDSQVTERIVDGGRSITEIRYGEAVFGPRPSPMSHSVTTTSKTDFRNIFIELLPREKRSTHVTYPPLSAGHIVLIDNERIRVNRLALKPGESSALHTHNMNGLGVMLYDSKVEITVIDGGTRVIEAKAGELVWQTAGTTHRIKNVGTKVFEAIDIEIK